MQHWSSQWMLTIAPSLPASSMQRRYCGAYLSNSEKPIMKILKLV